MKAFTLLLLATICLPAQAAPRSHVPHIHHARKKARTTLASMDTVQHYQVGYNAKADKVNKPVFVDLKHQLAAKDVVIAALRHQLKDAQGQIQILQKRQAADLDAAVQNYNALMHGAVEDREKCGSDYQRALASPLSGNPPTVASLLASRTAVEFAQKSNIEFNSMQQKVNQALVLHKQILASPLFRMHYVEKEPCLSPDDLSDDLRAAGAADLRFMERR